MIEKVKIGIWDLFAYLLPGTVIVISVMVHCLCTGTIKFSQLQKVPGAVTVVVVVLVLVVLGLLLEPLTNFLFKLPTLFKNQSCMCKLNFSSIGFKDWDNSLSILEEKAKQVAEDHGDHFSFKNCKSWVVLNGDMEEFNSFLGKYGFYRNITIINVLNIVVALFLYESFAKWIVCGVLLLLAKLYSYRSDVFYRHQEEVIHNQYIIGRPNQSKSSEE